MTVYGIDISDNNGSVTHSAIPSSVAFEYVKATQGDQFVAHTFAANTAGARAAGKLVGAYHFADLNGTAVAQATHFASVVGKPGAGHLDPVLDFEGMLLASFQRLGDVNGAAAWVRAFMATADPRTGRRCGIYASDSTVKWFGAAWSHLSAGRLIWLARIGAAPAHPCHVWQYSWTGRVPGVSGDVDVDQFNVAIAPWAHLSTTRTLRLTHPMMHGADVTAVQVALNRHRFTVTVDSYYGAQTAAAVLAFKKTIAWLPHNGIVGAGTRKALGL